MNFKPLLEKHPVTVSVPCRIDLGGTLDISTFFLPLGHKNPSSFNIALDMRTTVTLQPWSSNRVKVSSKGFETAEFEKGTAPFDHPMGLMFAVAQYFNAHGLWIHIASGSPPRSALGGSSSAAVAMVAAFHKVLGIESSPGAKAWLAHYIESSVAGVPCGIQDQLAAAYGGVHQWVWKMGEAAPAYKKRRIFTKEAEQAAFNDNILVAYCGIPHVSKDINQRWVISFCKGETRSVFEKICDLTKDFCRALELSNFSQAAGFMNDETRLRLEMTPDVLDNTGKKLFEMAKQFNCGARFTGAGGGGCLWAVGPKEDIQRLLPAWQTILEPVKGAAILDTRIDNNGILAG